MDLRKIILEDLDPSTSRVEFTTKPIVLLCGGHVPEKKAPGDPDPVDKSIRHRIVKSFPEFEIFRPEEIDNWQVDGIFKNLMDFESDLANICSLVVIILESAGAIAELGAFSQLEDFKKKLVIFVSDEHADMNSFINLGILRFISRDHESGVRRHPWSSATPANAPEDVVQDIIDDIQDELDNLHKSQTLKISNGAHIMIVICELVRLFIALKDSEIVEALQLLGNDIKKEDVRRKLFLLERLEFIKTISHSDSKFYASNKYNLHSLRFALKSQKKYDPIGLRLDLLDYYQKTKSERNRARAIQKAKMGATA